MLTTDRTANKQPPNRSEYILVIFLGAEFNFVSQGTDQGPLEQSGVNNKGAEAQR